MGTDTYKPPVLILSLSQEAGLEKNAFNNSRLEVSASGHLLIHLKEDYKLTTQDLPDGYSKTQIFIYNLPLCVVNIKTPN
jgi:hypothetical protein